MINDALRNNADLIFLAGIDTDAVRLAHALALAIDANPGNLTLARLKILGGDAIDTGLILGQGDGPDAAIARNFPQDIQRLFMDVIRLSGRSRRHRNQSNAKRGANTTMVFHNEFSIQLSTAEHIQEFTKKRAKTLCA